MSEETEREAVDLEAQSWVRTPYHHEGRVKGAGVDCGQLLIETFAETGLIARPDTGHYTHDWHMHRGEERYLSFVEQYASRIDDSELSLTDRLALDSRLSVRKGNVLLWRVGRTFSHAAIVSTWPYIIHAYFPSMMVERVSVIGTPMAMRPMRVYSYWGR